MSTPNGTSWSAFVNEPDGEENRDGRTRDRLGLDGPPRPHRRRARPVLVDREPRHDAAGLSALIALLLAPRRRSGGDRAAGRDPGRAAARRRARGARDPPQPGRRRAPAFRAAAGKSDGFDAYVLAELARTDAHRFRRAGARQRRDQGAAGAHPRPRRPGRRRVELWPTGCAPSSTASGPAPTTIFADLDSPDRAGLPRALPQPRRRPRARREPHA